MTKPIPSAALALTLALAAAAAAQPPDRPGGGQRPGTQRFEEVAPKVGEALPDFLLYDEKGEEVHFRELARGRHTVLVLGCLT